METLSMIINIVMLVVAVLLVVVVLCQDAKSSGLGSAFGNDTTAFGQSRSRNLDDSPRRQSQTMGQR